MSHFQGDIEEMQYDRNGPTPHDQPHTFGSGSRYHTQPHVGLVGDGSFSYQISCALEPANIHEVTGQNRAFHTIRRWQRFLHGDDQIIKSAEGGASLEWHLSFQKRAYKAAGISPQTIA